VLVQRVRKLSPADEIEQRYGLIEDFEARVAAGGTRIIKVMLHISKDEQKGRLQERLDRPDKHWKYNPGDVDDRSFWDQYQQAYQVALERTSTDIAPWYVVPADKKWYARIAVQQLLIDVLEDINPQWPTADFDVAAEKKRLAES
jgi:polyphosphate kinase 2 (PPK2 family)